MSTKAETSTPTVTGQVMDAMETDDAQDEPMKAPPRMKRELSITTPTWDARADAQLKDKEENARMATAFKAEVKRQASLLSYGGDEKSAEMLTVDDDEDSDEELPQAGDPNPNGDASSEPAKGMPSEADDQKVSDFDDKEHPELMGCYEPQSQRTLGSGAYGIVSKVKCIKIQGHSRAKVGEIYALKKIRNVFRNRTDAKRILRELRILRSMRHHDCVVRVIDILIPQKRETFKDLYVVFELIDTDMSRVFASDQNFKILHVKYFLYQILRALKYMHSANLVHRDLKPANVLVNEDCSLRVADFGLSRCISEIPEQLRGIFHGKRMKKQLTEHMQTRWYRAPEVCLLEQRRDTQFSMDIWGCGCILGELLQMVTENQKDYSKRKPLFRGSWSQKHSPRRGAMDVESSQIARIIEVLGTPTENDLWFCGERSKELVAKIPKAKEQPWAKKFPGTDKEGLDMLASMLRFDPRKRLDVDGCLKHPFMAEVRQPADELRHQKVTFEFEDVDLHSSLIREIIIEEIYFYHPEMRDTKKYT